MRLICPNCEAQYEVAPSAVPENGRDVQCSSCGKTWFQKSASQLESEGITADAASASANLADQEMEHREPDRAVQDILREEAARETEARQEPAQAKPKASKDLGLDRPFEDAPDSPTPQPQVAAATMAGNTALRGALPDSDELNSTLRTADDDFDAEVLAEQKGGRSGFRTGFGLVLTLAALALLAYTYAPDVIKQVPQSKPYMNTYVDKVDELRVWVDQMMVLATDKISEMSGG